MNSHSTTLHRCAIPGCRNKFYPKSGRQKYCSPQCSYAAWYAKRVKYRVPGKILYCRLKGCKNKILKTHATLYCCVAHRKLAGRYKHVAYALRNGIVTARQKVDVIKKMNTRIQVILKKEDEPKPAPAQRPVYVPGTGIHEVDPVRIAEEKASEAAAKSRRKYYK